MDKTINLPLQNLKGRPARSITLLLLTALTAFSVLAGTIVISSLRTGLSSLENRLGADIMVVPNEAKMKSSLESIVLQGNIGYFYMKDEQYQKICQCEGIGQISPQFFLATTSSGCCSLPVQIIGFDPETDFTVQPWIKRTYGGTLGKFDIVVGNDLNAFVGDTLTFYGVECHVAAKLDKTGTSYDTTVFTNPETISALIASSVSLNMNEFSDVDPNKAVSCVLINAAEGYPVEELLNDINIHVKKVKAVRTKEMISGISDSLRGVSGVIAVLIAVIWLLSLLILLLVYTMSIHERKKEFAILRTIGASGKMLSGIVWREALMIGFSGAVIGTVIGIGIVLPFHTLIEEQLALPFLLPTVGQILFLIGAAVILTIIVSTVSAAKTAYQISKTDPALILRSDNG